MPLPELKIKIGVDAKAVKAKLAAVRGQVAKLRDGLDDFNRRMDRVRTALSLTVGAIALGVGKTATELDNIAKTADKLGLTTDALQELRVAADLSGVATATFDMAMQRFGRRVAEARRGTGEAKDALKELGIEFTDNEGRLKNIDQLFSDVADKMSQVANQTDRNRIAMKLFDSEGVALVNMLRDGSTGLEEMRQRAVELGLVIDENLIRSAEQAKDQFSLMGQSMRVGVQSVLATLLPMIQGATQAFGQFIGTIARSDTVRTSLAGMAVSISAVAAALVVAKGAAILFRSALLATGVGVFVVGLGLIIGKVIELSERVGGFGKLWTLVGNVFREVIQRMGMNAQVFVLHFKTMAANIQSVWVNTIAFLAQKWADFVSLAGSQANALAAQMGLGEVVDVFGVQAWASSFEASTIRAGKSVEALGLSLGTMKALVNSPLSSLDELNKALTETTETGEEVADTYSGSVPEALAKTGGGAKEMADQVKKAQEQMKALASSIEGSIMSAFDSIIDGTKSVAGGYKDMVSDILKQVARLIFQQNIAGPLAQSLAGVFTNAFPNLLAPTATSAPTIGSAPIATGSIAPNVTVNNTVSDIADVSVSSSGSDLFVMVDKAVASSINSGGASYSAIRDTFALSPTLTKRA